MTTEQHAAISLVARTSPPVCGCGQDLDVCTAQHCPRCGTSLVGHPAVAA